jgi:hypothetical protein
VGRHPDPFTGRRLEDRLSGAWRGTAWLAVPVDHGLQVPVELALAAAL